MATRDVIIRLGARERPGSAGEIAGIKQELNAVRRSALSTALAMGKIGGKTLLTGFRQTFGLMKSFAHYAGIAGIAMGVLTHEAMKLDTGMAKVSTIFDGSRRELTGIKEDLKRLSVEYGVSSASLAEGAYQTVSSGIKAAGDIKTFMRAATRASVAGQAEQAAAVDIMSSALKAYTLRAGDAERVSDLLFTAVKEGKTEFGLLAENMGPLLKIAPQLGISLKETLAGVATLTQKGGMASTPIVITEMKSAMMAFLKPSEDMLKWSKKLGYEHSSLIVKEKGFAGALELVRKSVGGNVAALGELFPNARGIAGILDLTGGSAAEFTRILGEMDSASGATGRALEKFTSSDAYKVNVALNAIREAGADLGEKILPLVADAIHDLGGGTGIFNSLKTNVEALIDAAGTLYDTLAPIGSFIEKTAPTIWLGKGLEKLGVYDRFLNNEKSVESGSRTGEQDFQQAEADRLARYQGLLKKQLAELAQREAAAQEQGAQELIQQLEQQAESLRKKNELVLQKLAEITGRSSEEQFDKMQRGLGASQSRQQGDIEAALETFS